MTPVGDLGDSFEEAFYALRGAYIKSAKSMSLCNVRVDKALKQIEDAEKIYGRQ